MQVQQADESVAFATLLAAVWLQRAMGLLVGLAGRRVREGLAALAAGEGLLTRVDSDVPLEVPCVRELLPTVLQEGGSEAGSSQGMYPRGGHPAAIPRTCG